MIDDIIHKLNDLRDRDPMYRLFGAKVHRYRLSAQYSEIELSAFETRHGVTLPEGYREFLLRVGGSGAGPYYGLLPLGHHQEALTQLSRPFPYTDEWNEPALDDEEYLAESITRGAMRICNTGDGGYELLIVTGPERGMIWADARYISSGLFPLPHSQDAERHMDFLDWYTEWLDRSLAELRGA